MVVQSNIHMYSMLHMSCLMGALNFSSTDAHWFRHSAALVVIALDDAPSLIVGYYSSIYKGVSVCNQRVTIAVHS